MATILHVLDFFLSIVFFPLSDKEKVVSLPFTDTTQQTMTVTETTTTITREEHTVSQLIKPMFTEPLEPEIYVRERGIAR